VTLAADYPLLLVDERAKDQVRGRKEGGEGEQGLMGTSLPCSWPACMGRLGVLLPLADLLTRAHVRQRHR
jgi:hypothetical protein